MAVLKVTKENFQAEVLDASVPVLVGLFCNLVWPMQNVKPHIGRHGCKAGNHRKSKNL